MTVVAELVARLRAETGDWTRNIDQAGRSLDGLEQHAQKSHATLGKLESAFNNVGTLAAATTITMAGSLAAIGVSYNTLLQRSTAAFTTLLGTKQAANDMVKTLHDFALTSPFPRQAFISGTQQLLGFGVSAKKIIPIMQSLQDTTAAIGGNQTDLQEFIGLFAQMQSVGRVNSRVLEEFGYHGVDAFKILAQQAGVSTEEMHKRVEAGALDSTKAVEMMTKGLESQFSGAAANVKTTWVGALDRVKGAWRDIGSELISPFINPTGGGVAVQWANNLADALRNLEKDVIIPFAAKMTEFFTKFQDTVGSVNWDAKFRSITDSVVKFKKEITDFLPVIGLLGLSFGKQALSTIPFVNQFTNMLPLPGKLALAFIGMAMGSKQVRDEMMVLVGALGKLAQDAGPSVLALFSAITSAVQKIAPSLIELLVQGVTALTPAFIAVVQAAVGLIEALTPVAVQLIELVTNSHLLVPILYAVAAGFMAIKAVEIGRSIATTVSGLANMIPTLRGVAAAHGLATAATAATETATTGAAAATTGLTGAVMGLNPWVAGGTALLTIGAAIAGHFAQQHAEAARKVHELEAAIESASPAAAQFVATLGKSGGEKGMTDTIAAFQSVLKGSDIERLHKFNIEAKDLVETLGHNKADRSLAGVAESLDGIPKPAALALISDELDKVAKKGQSVSPIVQKMLDEFASGEISARTLADGLDAVQHYGNILGQGVGDLADKQKVATYTANGMKDATKGLAGTLPLASDALKGLINNWEELSQKPVADWFDAANKAIQSDLDPLKAWSNMMDQAAQKGAHVTASLQQWMKDMEHHERAVAAWKNNIATLIDKGFTDMAADMAKKGPEASGSFVDSFLKASATDQKRAYDDWKAAGTNTIDGFVDGILSTQAILAATGKSSIDEVVKSLNFTPAQRDQLFAGVDGTMQQKMEALAVISAYQGGQVTKDFIDALGKIPPEMQAILDQIEAKFAVDNKFNVKFNITPQIVMDAIKIDPNSITAELGRQLAGAAHNANGSITAYAAGGENHVAQIARGGEWRLWAEPETGGEAYIPLSLSKRGRSMDILAQVAQRFGVRLAKFASGGTDPYSWFNDPNYTDPYGNDPAPKKGKKGSGSGSGGGLDFNAIMGMQDTMFDVGAMGLDDYKELLQKRLASFTKFTSEWKSAYDRLQQVTKTAEDNVKNYLQALYNDQKHTEDNMARVGAIGNTQYLGILNERLSGLKRYSDEWTQVWDQINQATSAALSTAQQAFDSSQSEIKNFAANLQSEAATIKGQMKSIEDGISSAYTTLYENANNSFTGQDKVIKDWRSQFVKAFGDAANAVAAFSSDKYISGQMVGMYFDQQLEQAKDFKKVLDSLSKSGVDAGLLRTLAAAGPKMLTFANALQEAVNSGDTGKINDAIQQLAGIGSAVADIAQATGSGGSDLFPTPPVPEYKTFDQLLAEEVKTYQQGQAVHDRALAWAQSMAKSLVQNNAEYADLNDQLNKVNAVLAQVAAAFPDLIAQTTSWADQWKVLAAAAADAASKLADAQKAQDQTNKLAGAGHFSGAGDLLISLPGGGQVSAAFLASQGVAGYTMGANGQVTIPTDATLIGYGGTTYTPDQIGLPYSTHAAGGSVLSGMSYLVGEHGPELLKMGSGGTGFITPNHHLGGGPSITVEKGAIAVSVAGGADRRMVDAAISDAMDDLIDRLTRLLEDS